MNENGLLEPSFADAMAAIEQAKELPASRRTHWCCSLRMIAKALERPPESIAARCGAVALKVNLLHHANSGIEWKTLANHKANAKAALLWFRGEQGLLRRGRLSTPQQRCIGWPAWILAPSATELYVNRICTSLPSSLRIA
jgi:hypothetical protein